ncbi:uncharacterized protein LOC144118569 isoform X1 [Amblyomma americanum]
MLLFGPVKSLRKITKEEWQFFAVSSLSLLVSLGFTVERLVTLPKTSDDYTFAIMLCFTSIFCFFYVVHGMLQERYQEIAVFMASTVLLTVYLIINVVSDVISGHGSGASFIQKAVRLGIALVLFLPLILVLGGRTAHTYRNNRWLMFEINASDEMQEMFGMLFLCSSLIFFDLQLQITMLIFVMNDGILMNTTEIVVLSVGVPVAIAFAVIGNYAIFNEKKGCLCVFGLLWTFNFAYLCYNFYYLHKHESWTELYLSTVACAAVALVVRLLLAINVVIVALNFGKGVLHQLKAHRTRQQELNIQMIPQDEV